MRDGLRQSPQKQCLGHSGTGRMICALVVLLLALLALPGVALAQREGMIVSGQFTVVGGRVPLSGDNYVVFVPNVGKAIAAPQVGLAGSTFQPLMAGADGPARSSSSAPRSARSYAASASLVTPSEPASSAVARLAPQPGVAVVADDLSTRADPSGATASAKREVASLSAQYPPRPRRTEAYPEPLAGKTSSERSVLPQSFLKPAAPTPEALPAYPLRAVPSVPQSDGPTLATEKCDEMKTPLEPLPDATVGPILALAAAAVYAWSKGVYRRRPPRGKL